MTKMEVALLGRTLDPVHAAVLLAMTQNRCDEDIVKQHFTNLGCLCVASTIGGVNDTVKSKIINATIGAALNGNVISKRTEDIHPLCHATIEAFKGAQVNDAVTQNCLMKVAVIRYKHWIAVCICGDFAIHEMSHHTLMGVGCQSVPTLEKH